MFQSFLKITLHFTEFYNNGSTRVIFLYITDKPMPLESLKVTEVRKDYAKLAWTPPESDGGAPIKNYHIEKRDTSKMTWLSAASVDSHTLDFKVCSFAALIIK